MSDVKDGSRLCPVGELQVGDFIEVPHYELLGEVTKVIEMGLVGDGKTRWFTLHVQPHDPDWPHNSLPAPREVVGPKRGTDMVVSWS